MRRWKKRRGGGGVILCSVGRGTGTRGRGKGKWKDAEWNVAGTVIGGKGVVSARNLSRPQSLNYNNTFVKDLSSYLTCF